MQERKAEKQNYPDNPLFHIVKEFLNKEKINEDGAYVFLKNLAEKYGIHKGAAIEMIEDFRREMLNVLNWLWTINDMEYFGREEHGVMLPNYISLVRIERAKKLLTDTQLAIPEIAERTGFFSANVFIVFPWKTSARSRKNVKISV